MKSNTVRRSIRRGGRSGSVEGSPVYNGSMSDVGYFGGEIYNIPRHLPDVVSIAWADRVAVEKLIVDDPGQLGVESSDELLTPNLYASEIQGVLEVYGRSVRKDHTVEEPAPVKVSPSTNLASSQSMSSAIQEQLQIGGFARGVRVKTLSGEVRVENIKSSDLILTLDAGYKKVQYVSSTKINSQALKNNPELYPVVISKNALTPNLPEKDLYVSSQHRVYISSRIAYNVFGESEILVSAKDLVGCQGVKFDYSVKEVEYFHLILEKHALIYASGSISECLFLDSPEFKIETVDRTEKLSLKCSIVPKDKQSSSLARMVIREESLIKKFIENHRNSERHLVEPVTLRIFEESQRAGQLKEVAA